MCGMCGRNPQTVVRPCFDMPRIENLSVVYPWWFFLSVVEAQTDKRSFPCQKGLFLFLVGPM